MPKMRTNAPLRLEQIGIAVLALTWREKAARYVEGDAGILEAEDVRPFADAYAADRRRASST